MAEVDLRTSREALSQAQAQLSQAQEQLAKTEIRSPLDGKVTAIYVKVGQTAVPSFSGIAGSTLVDVADTTSIDAEINVDETDIARVKVGADARVVPAAFPDKVLHGKVDQVAIAPRQIRRAEQELSGPHPPDQHGGRGVPSRHELPRRGPHGIRRRAEGARGSRAVAALRRQPGQIRRGGKIGGQRVCLRGRPAKKRTVTTGTADDSYIAIISGLKEGEQVVSGPAKTLLFLLDGEKVKHPNTAKTEPAAKK